MRRISANLFFLPLLLLTNSCSAQKRSPAYTLPPMPVKETKQLGFISDPSTFPEVKMDFPMAPGPFEPNWQSIDKNYPGEPAWWRDAKFGVFIHWGPQAAGKSGDWYARRLYEQDLDAYKNHVKSFGHPSEFGYKDVLHQWNPSQWDPAKLVQAYYDAGFRYALVVGVHHDNYDLWNSRYHPWNSVQVGPKKDFLARWKKELNKHNMRFGVAFHHEYTWWWYQTAFGSDSAGPKAGVPYDGNLTLADGKGKWWQGLDPKLLYTIPLGYKPVDSTGKPYKLHLIAHGYQGIFGNHLDYAKWYATQWAMRIEDVIDQYDPDFIYTDGNSTQPFSGYKSGSGIKCDAGPRVVAHFYNKAMANKHKPFDKLSIVKFLPTNRGAGTTFEGRYSPTIKTDQPWMADMAVGDWFYQPGFYYDAGMVVRALLEHVSRDGNLTLCVSLTPEGAMDEGSAAMLKAIGAWMKINGEGIYGSKAWKILGEGEQVINSKTKESKLKTLPGGKLGKQHADFTFSTKDFRFTQGKNGAIYAYCLTVPQPGEVITIKSFGSAAKLLERKIRSVSLLGSKEQLQWEQVPEGLTITYPNVNTSRFAVAFKIDLESSPVTGYRSP
ncbi:alpha-L-fucosidase [Longitalea arenae]|uniref:alpha-L-fucosidase n=1 Tax=Longitalea arenae TaxID=2812558 RepID=UPI0019689674|nr:alpha-L-fucosidase [Longitalea arenae]